MSNANAPCSVGIGGTGLANQALRRMARSHWTAERQLCAARNGRRCRWLLRVTRTPTRATGPGPPQTAAAALRGQVQGQSSPQVSIRVYVDVPRGTHVQDSTGKRHQACLPGGRYSEGCAGGAVMRRAIHAPPTAEGILWRARARLQWGHGAGAVQQLGRVAKRCGLRLARKRCVRGEPPQLGDCDRASLDCHVTTDPSQQH